MFKINTRTTPYFTLCSSVFIADFEQVIAGWVSFSQLLVSSPEYILIY